MSFYFSIFLFYFWLNILFSAEQPDLNAGSPERQNAGAHHGYVFCFNAVITLLKFFVV